MRHAFPYWQRSLQLLGSIARGRPAICTLQVTNRCNMRCSFCAFWSDGAPPPEELSLAQLARVSEKLAAIGSFIVSVEGGEPMLRPDLVEIVHHLARYHHPVLYTNGWYVDEENARELFLAGMVQVGISLDYATAARHDAHRLPGSFDRVMRAVECFQKAARDPRRQIHLMTVLMEDNLDEIEPLLLLSRRLGIRHRLTLLAVEGHNRAGGKRPPKAGVSARLRALKRRYPHLVTPGRYLDQMDDFLRGAYQTPCQAGRMGLNINHIGETNPCIELADVSAGRFLDVPLERLFDRLSRLEEVKGCQRCYTLCRGHVQILSRPPHLKSLWELLR